MHVELLLGVEDPLLRMLVLAVLVGAKVVVTDKVVRQFLEVLVVHVVVRPRLLAQEALHVLRLHVAVKLLVRVEVLLAELTRRVTLEPGIRHHAGRVPPLVVPGQLGPRVKDLLVHENLPPPEANVAHEQPVAPLQVRLESLHRLELQFHPLAVAHGASQRALHIHVVPAVLVVVADLAARLQGKERLLLDPHLDVEWKL
mmetsp:Transcript_13269/g.37247  ORF Transcript_13269/g.37247 Transcript_13269/m.37247 type:complete len:200 (+) Transcript_13269:4136-4735(+)